MIVCLIYAYDNLVNVVFATIAMCEVRATAKAMFSRLRHGDEGIHPSVVPR